jgi:hypothetical protein
MSSLPVDSNASTITALDRPCLAYTVAFDQPGASSLRQMAKILVGSLLRNYFPGDIVVFRNTLEPLYLVERKGLREIYVDTPELHGKTMQECAMAFKYRARHWLYPEDGPESECAKVMFIDADCLCLRNLDHLLLGNEQILYTEEPGIPWRQPQFSTFMTDEELKSEARNGINSGTMVVEGNVYAAVMAEWERIDETEAARERKFSEQGAFQRLVWEQQRKDGPWKAAKMETREVSFPLHIHRDFMKYRDAAILHFVGGNAEEKLQLMFAMYMAFFFRDKSGMFMNLLET